MFKSKHIVLSTYRPTNTSYRIKKSEPFRLASKLLFYNFKHLVNSLFHIGNEFELSPRSVDILFFSRVAEINVAVEIIRQKSYSTFIRHHNRAERQVFAFDVRYRIAEHAEIPL